MDILAIILFAFLFLRTIIALVNNLFQVHLPEAVPSYYPKVSILIPARNEEKNIGNLLNDLKRLDYPKLEIIVCNDHSTDQTKKILQQSGENGGTFIWFDSDQIPEGWGGKNFACHQLALRATGDYFLFIDADMNVDPSILNKALAYSLSGNLALLSVFPHLIMKSSGEKITSPLMHWILVSLLPLPLVRISRRPSLSAAAGGFMLFEGTEYRENRWHMKVKNLNVEDIIIAREVKAAGLRTATLLGNNDVYARMYEGYCQALHGFSKNVHQYFGGNIAVMVFFWLAIVSGPFVAVSEFGMTGLMIFTGLVIFNRILISLASRQSPFVNILYHPLQMMSFTLIVFRNIIQKIRRKAEWKGRNIEF